MSTIAWLTTLQFAGVNALFALAVYASLWTGALSLAPVFFGAVSAFTFGALAGSAGLPAFVALIIGVLLGAALGAVTASLVIRLDSHYLAMATIAIVLIGRVLVLNLTKFTGGDPDLINVNGLYPGVNKNPDNNGTLDYYPSTTQLLLGVQLTF